MGELVWSNPNRTFRGERVNNEDFGFDKARTRNQIRGFSIDRVRER